MSLFKRYYPVLVAVLVAVLPLGMNTYWTEVAVNVGLYALLALSLNVILGQAGIFHMGHAAFYAVGAYVTAILNTHYQIPILLLIPVAGAAAAHRDHRHRGNRPHRPDQRRVRPDRRRERHFRHRPS